MKKHRRLLWSLGLSAMMGLMAGEARAELISMTLSVTGAASSFNVDLVATPGAQTYSVSPTALLAINGYLSGNGSEYSFVQLGGSSNWSGTSAQALLTVTGEVDSIGTGNAGLTLTETEAGFTAPTGNNGLLASSSSATFTNQPAGGGNSVMGSYNAMMTPAYSVLSTGTPPNSPGGAASLSVGTVGPASYTLGNMVSFNLSAGSSTMAIKDQFTASTVLTATVIPEPASLVMFMTGMPLPLVLVGLLRRRRRAVAQG